MERLTNSVIIALLTNFSAEAALGPKTQHYPQLMFTCLSKTKQIVLSVPIPQPVGSHVFTLINLDGSSQDMTFAALLTRQAAYADPPFVIYNNRTVTLFSTNSQADNDYFKLSSSTENSQNLSHRAYRRNSVPPVILPTNNPTV